MGQVWGTFRRTGQLRKLSKCKGKRKSVLKTGLVLVLVLPRDGIFFNEHTNTLLTPGFPFQLPFLLPCLLYLRERCRNKT